MKRGARIALFLLVQLVLTALLLEASLRIAAPHAPGLRTLLGTAAQGTDYSEVETLEALLEQSVLGFVPFEIRGGFRLNSRSLCTREYTKPGRPGARRIMVLGDSYAFACGGVPFHLMWHTLIEDGLNQTEPQPVEVFSLGVPAVGPMFQLRMWQLEHELVRPDLVIAAFYVGNDFTDEQGRLADPRLESPLFRASTVLRLGRNLMRLRQVADHRHARAAATGSATTARNGGYITDRTVPDRPPVEMTDEQHGRLMATRLLLWTPDNRERLDILAAHVSGVLERLHQEVTTYGADFLVVLIPEAFQIDEELLDRSLDRLDLTRPEIDLDRPQRILIRHLAEAGIATFDLTPGLRAAGRDEALYWERDPHWNVAGNRVAGRLLTQHVRSR